MNVKEYIDEFYPEIDLIVADGLDEAFIGVGFSVYRAFACYDWGKVIDGLMADGMTREEAVEYFDFNIGSAYVGDNTPIFIENVNEVLK